MTSPPTACTTVRRIPKRGAYDRVTIGSILDEGLICHAGFVVDGTPFVILTIYARDGQRHSDEPRNRQCRAGLTAKRNLRSAQMRSIDTTSAVRYGDSSSRDTARKLVKLQRRSSE